MTLLLILGAALVLLAIVLISAAAGSTAGGHAATGVDRSVALVQALGNAPGRAHQGVRRVRSATGSWTPLQQRASRIARRLSGSDAPERIRKRLDVAGNPAGWTIERVQAGKVIGAITLFLISPRSPR